MKRLELFVERWYVWFIYPVFFGIIISLFLMAASGLSNLPSFFAAACFIGAHDSLYCWKHGNHIFPTIDPLWIFYKRIEKEEYFEKHCLVVGVVATIIGAVLFCISTVMFVVKLPSLIQP